MFESVRVYDAANIAQYIWTFPLSSTSYHQFHWGAFTLLDDICCIRDNGSTRCYRLHPSQPPQHLPEESPLRQPLLAELHVYGGLRPFLTTLSEDYILKLSYFNKPAETLRIVGLRPTPGTEQAGRTYMIWVEDTVLRFSGRDNFIEFHRLGELEPPKQDGKEESLNMLERLVEKAHLSN